MKVIYPCENYIKNGDEKIVFLAGSIEMGKAREWQQEIITKLSTRDNNLVLLNPRRLDWDSSLKQDKENKEFKSQVDWELNGLETSDLIVMYLDPSTKSPVSLLEFGFFHKKIVMCCPDGFWRGGNIAIMCDRYNIKRVDTIDDLINVILN